MIERRAEVSSDSSQLDVPPPRVARSLALARSVALTALCAGVSGLWMNPAPAQALDCYTAIFYAYECGPYASSPSWCWAQELACATGSPLREMQPQSVGCQACATGDSRTRDCPLGVGSEEICGNGADDNFNGCSDEGCEREYYGDPACTCQRASCAEPACSTPPYAECDPEKDDVREVPGDGRDNNCNGAVDEGGAADDPVGGGPPGGGPPPPPPPGPGPTCGEEGGVDPLLLANRSAATNPFSDFSVSAITRLGVSRTWTSLDASYFGGPTGIFGSGWHHDWEATLTCSGEFCTVARGAREGLRFVKAETAPSLDGAETWQLYRPPTGDTNAARRNLLVRRPAGEWVLFTSDGQAMHFATACDAEGPDPE